MPMLCKVNPNISDLFFNTEHRYNPKTGDYVELREEAADFLSALERLNVSTPTVDELIGDFHARI